MGKAAQAAATSALAAILASAGPGADDASARTRCDPLDPAHCLLPWPNDHFTRKARTPTGRRLALRRSMMPRNASGAPINPRDYNRSDGFSPGQTIVTRVPGLDTPEAFRRTGAVPVNDMARARPPPADRRDQRPHAAPASDLGGARLERKRAAPGDASDPSRRELPRGRALHRRPAPAPPRRRPATPRSARVPRLSGPPAVALRGRQAPPRANASSGGCGARISRRDLYLAWDFTVASRSSLAKRMLSIRNRAFARLGVQPARHARGGKSPGLQRRPRRARHGRRAQGLRDLHCPCT